LSRDTFHFIVEKGSVWYHIKASAGEKNVTKKVSSYLVMSTLELDQVTQKDRAKPKLEIQIGIRT
jgi:hypothetical protein